MPVPLQGRTVTARVGTCHCPSLPHTNMTYSCCWPQPSPLHEVFESYMWARQDVLSKDRSLKVSLWGAGVEIWWPHNEEITTPQQNSWRTDYHLWVPVPRFIKILAWPKPWAGSGRLCLCHPSHCVQSASGTARQGVWAGTCPGSGTQDSIRMLGSREPQSRRAAASTEPDRTCSWRHVSTMEAIKIAAVWTVPKSHRCERDLLFK